MAFLTELTINGRAYIAAYVKATVERSDATTTIIKLQAWETQALREAGVPPLSWNNDLRALTTATSPSDNPVAYGYNLIEASDEFPDAVWNV